jgi:hypothetical protein
MAKVAPRSASGRFVPIGYIVVAIALAAILLPTALRPPVDQTSTTSAFSPDAPPDDSPPEALLTAIKQASSSTAGGKVSATAVVDEPPEEAAPPPPPPPPPKKPKATRNGCFGDPPRQTESLYATLCVPAWTGGDNGGATAFGVTADEIRVGYGVGESSTVAEGPLDFAVTDTDGDSTRRLKKWMEYFNSNYEFYGRKMRFVIEKQSITDEDQQRQSVARFQEEKTFVITAPGYGQPSAAQAETVRRKMIDFGTVLAPCQVFAKNYPYMFSFIIDGCSALKFQTEMICKQFGSTNPPGLLNKRKDTLSGFDYEAPRKYGIIVYEDETHFGGVEGYRDELAKCGIKPVADAKYNLTASQADIAASIAKMRQAGVTTILLSTEVITPIVLTAAATKLNYYPEWISTGMETLSTARLADQSQMENMVGSAGLEIARANADTDWYRAYKEVDPDGPDPEEGAFRSLQQISNAIQGAGPELTPETFWQGLAKIPHRAPDPVWSIGGGYGPENGYGAGDYTYMDYIGIIWWDRNGQDPNSTSKGAWQWVYKGQRWTMGNAPAEPLPWWDPNQAFTSPPRGVQG